MSSLKLKLETPAAGWRDALPSGNGVLGALVYGRVAGERILFNHEALWSQGNTPPVPETARRLPELRAMLAEGRFAEAETFFPELWEADGFHAEAAHYLPGPDLCIRSVPTHPFSDYRAELDMQTGEVSVSWRENGYHYSRRVMVSKADGIAAVYLSTDNPDGLDVRVGLQAHDPQDSLEYSGFGGVSAPCAQSAVSGDKVCLTASFSDGTSYGAELKVCGTQIRVEGAGIRIRGSSSATVLFRMSPEKNETGWSWPKWPEQVCYQTLLERHTAIHQELMDRLSFSLDRSEDPSNERLLLDEIAGRRSSVLIEKLVQYGRYLLVCSSTGEAKYPANLQGIWNGDYRPAWSGGFFVDENIEMACWPALSGNLMESMLPFFNLFEAKMDDFRENAQRVFGCRGILLPLFMSPRSGRKHNPQPHCVHWTAGGSWISQHFFDYYLYTGDEKFLKERAFPFMREAALFYEDFFTEGADGFWVSSPSMSPENFPLGDFPEAGTFRVCVNATMDFAAARELFGNLIAAAEQTGLCREEIPGWKAFAKKIPPYRINEDGAITEWMDDRLKDNYHHRHMAHLYPLFPGRETCRLKEPELFEACLKAVEKRLIIGIADQTGWSLAHMASIYARLGEGNRALECIHLLTRSCLGKNFFTYHNSDLDMGITQPLIHGMPAPFQIDANFGITAAVLEMLVFSRSGFVHVLPALPETWGEGVIRGVRCHGGVTVDIEWNSLIVRARLNARQAMKVCVQFIDQLNAEIIELRPDTPMSLTFNRKRKGITE